MNEKLKSISWDVDETTYREDKALSYSTLARFTREGFNKLDSLFTKIETPSLTFGSAVDAIITGGQEEFDNNFLVADFPPITDSILKVVKVAFNKYKEQYTTLIDIPSDNLIKLTEELAYQLNWKPETRVKVIKEQGNDYYSLLYVAGDKKIIDLHTKEDVDKAVEALHTSKATKLYFAPNSPFEDIYREYQLKFKAKLEGVEYRCMADLLLTDHINKIIYPIDLKTSSHAEWDFYESFIQWNYAIQARLYWRIIRHNLDKSEIFKNYKLDDYRFIVVNRKTLTPLVWKYPDTQAKGKLVYGKRGQIEMEDPCVIGTRLAKYLSYKPSVPEEIKIDDDNNLNKWLNEII